MARLHHIPTDPEDLRYRPKVFFACHPEDHVVYFDEVVKQLQAFSHCAVYFYSPEDMVGQDAHFYEELDAMNLFVIPVTAKLLCQPNWAMDVLFPYAQRFPKPVLPLMMERGLEAEYEKKFGNLQFLDKCNEDPTVLPYEEKLKRYLQSKLVSDEQVKKIQSAFDAYVFLSYRKKDRKYAQQLMRLLHRDPVCRDIAIWYDEFLTPGENFNSTILEALQRSKLFALVVTPNVLEKPNYVLDPEYKCASEFGKPVLPAQMLQTDTAALRECCPNIPDAIDPADESAMTRTILEAMRGIALRENDKDPLHNFFIGLAYLNGIDVEIDHDRAVQLISGAAETGLTEAMEKLVDMYETGDGVPRDYRAAIQWREKLVEKARLQYEQTGNCNTYRDYLRKLGDAKKDMMDYAGAEEAYLSVLKLAEESAWAGDIYIQSAYKDLVSLYRADPTKGNLQKAKPLATKLMEMELQYSRENPRCYFYDLYESYRTLGHLAMEEKDLESAKTWYLKCAEILEEEGVTGPQKGKGYVSMLYNNLGDIYIEQMNLAEARTWYTKSLQYAEAMLPMHSDYKAYLRHVYNRMSILCEQEALFADDAVQKEKYAEAKDWAQKNIVIVEEVVRTEKLGDLEELFLAYFNMVGVCRENQCMVEAEMWCKKAHEIAHTMMESGSAHAKLHMFRICAENASIWMARGYDISARGCYLEALQYEEEILQEGMIDEKRALYAVYMHMGDISKDYFSKKDATNWYQKQLKIAEELAQTGLSRDVERLAIAYYVLAQCRRSKKLMKKMLVILQKLAAENPQEQRFKGMIRETEEEIDNMRIIKRILRPFRRKKDKNG